MAEPFRCNCGAPHCPGEIAGFRFLSPPRRDALRPYLSHTSPVREPTGPEAINPAGRRRIGFPGVRRRTQS
jgi:hypothetical protein